MRRRVPDEERVPTLTPNQVVAYNRTPEKTQEIVGGTETILVAEDEPAYRELIETVLKNAGYTVITAADGFV